MLGSWLPLLSAVGCRAPALPEVALPEHRFERVILVSIDTLRRDRLLRYASPSRPSVAPVLDGLAAESLVLDDHLSCASWTYPSMLCMTGGRSDVELGFVPEIGLATDLELYDGDGQFLSDWFAVPGWPTALVTANGFLCEAAGGGAFDHEVCANATLGPDITDAALGLAAELVASPSFFLHVHYIDPHQPYVAPESFEVGAGALEPVPYDLTSDRDLEQIEADWPTLDAEVQASILAHLDVLYDAEVRYVDAEVGRLIEGLDGIGALSGAVVLLVADHGEQLLEHGFIGHARTLHAEETRTMAMFWSPDGALPVEGWSGPTTHQDLAATLLSWTGLPIPDVVTGTAVGLAADDRVRFQTMRLRTPQVAITQGSRRLFYDFSGVRSFYRIDADPMEAIDVYDPSDPEVTALWALLGPEVDRIATVTGQTPIDPGP